MHIPDISVTSFDYPLPENRIPDKPVPERDQSKLLLYKKGAIGETKFFNLSEHLPANTLLVFNDTKVFPARLIFKKESGASIEVFCLQPLSHPKPNNNTWSMMWECMVGNLKRWKNEETLTLTTNEVWLEASLMERKNDACVVQLAWKGEENIFSVLEKLAELPLPPYMNRKATTEDKKRYQTIYANYIGSVAAPTAGLHFTQRVVVNLENKDVSIKKLTLHVGAGTFKPIKTDTISTHEMHAERFAVDKNLILALLSGKVVIPVGTTSLRVLESLYWLGIKIHSGSLTNGYEINQWDDIRLHTNTPPKIALETLLTHMEQRGEDTIHGSTQIFIVPGYTFRICSGLVTNFHQPKSTLILLVAALLGENWKKVYNYALENEFRFLSYGDSSLLLP